MSNTKIEWADRVWNPVTGCTKVSPGCAHCYAERMAKRLAGRCGYPTNEPFKVTLHPDKLDEPDKWKKPARIFVCSMGDLFHDDVPDSFLDKVFAMMAKASQHTFLVLTKRPERMRDYILKAMCDEDCNYDGWYEAIAELGIPDATPMENVWLGVTAENQEQADKRIPILLQIPAAKRFVSVEPMIGPVDLMYPKTIWPDGPQYCCSGRDCGCHGMPIDPPLIFGFGNRIDWVICGGESGPGARPMHPDWVRSLRDQCQASGTPFLFKQWGGWLPNAQEYGCYNPGVNFEQRHVIVGNILMCHVGKKKAGRLLDGQLWDQYPRKEDAE